MAKSKSATKEKSSEAAPSTASPSTSAPAAASAAETPTYQVLARRYRSRDFDELVGQDAIARTLQNAIRTGRTAHAYLFTGTRGVGKTSMARIFARALNATEQLTEQEAVAGAIMRGEDIDVIEIDAASNRGIDNARDLISGAGLMPARGRYKIYIIDEVHMLTTPAFNALLKTMEEPPSHVKFILCTTEPQSVPATIQSRCQRFDFRPIPAARIAAHLRDVLARENAEADERVVLQVARMANGSMRDSLSLLERLLAAAEPDASGRLHCTWALLEDIFGLPDESLVERIVEAIGAGDVGGSLAAAAALLERGMSIERALDLLAERYRWLMLSISCGKDTELLEVASETRETIARLAARYPERFDAASLAHLIALCDAVASKARDASSPRALFDAAIVRMALSESFRSAASLLANGPAASATGAAGGAGSAPPGKAPPRAVETSVRPAATTSAAGFASAPAATRAPQETTPLARPVTSGAAERLVESKPTPATTPLQKTPSPQHAAPCATNAEGFWSALIAKAASSPRDGAMLSSLVCKGWDGQTLHLAVREGEAGTGYLSSNPDMVRSVMQRLAGQPIEVRLEVEAVAQPKQAVAQRGLIPPEIREHPVVKLASELFDAVVVDWVPLRRGEATAAGEASATDVPANERIADGIADGIEAVTDHALATEEEDDV
jgi:DNA polymerase III subunit gamma/tau